MILREISEYIKSNKLVSVMDVVNHFDIEKDFVLTLLDDLERRNRIKHLGSSCGSCSGSCAACAVADIDYIQWIG